jgi:hypothetical protein
MWNLLQEYWQWFHHDCEWKLADTQSCYVLWCRNAELIIRTQVYISTFFAFNSDNELIKAFLQCTVWLIFQYFQTLLRWVQSGTFFDFKELKFVHFFKHSKMTTLFPDNQGCYFSDVRTLLSLHQTFWTQNLPFKNISRKMLFTNFHLLCRYTTIKCHRKLKILLDK